MKTENDKKIIEIVKDFMPKDLVIGTIFKNKEKGFIHIYLGKSPSGTDTFTDIYGGVTGNRIRWEKYEILGTLDTTVILKYVNSKKGCRWFPVGDEIWIGKKQGIHEEHYKIQLKPYNLLSEEEKGEMLEILLKL